MTTNEHPASILTETDWNEIYYALKSQLTSVVVDGDRRWKADLEEIIEKIGPDGRYMYA